MTERRKESFFQIAISGSSREDTLNQEEFYRRLTLAGFLIDDAGQVSFGNVPPLIVDGSGITGLDADNLATGTVPLARLVGITNTEIAAGAAIAQSKLALSITNAEVNASAAIAYSKLSIADGDLTWAKVSKSGSSLADLATKSAGALDSGNLSYARMPTGSGTWTATPTISGVVTFSSVPVFSAGLGAITASGNIDFAGFDLTASDGSATFTTSKATEAIQFVSTNATSGSGNRIISINLSALAATDVGSQLVTFRASGSEMGRITTNNNAVAYNTTSDERLKTVIAESQGGLGRVLQMRVSDFYWNNDPEQRVVRGFLAQQLYPFCAEAVGVGGDDPTRAPWSVDYGRVTPELVLAIQELTARMERAGL